MPSRLLDLSARNMTREKIMYSGFSSLANDHNYEYYVERSATDKCICAPFVKPRVAVQYLKLNQNTVKKCFDRDNLFTYMNYLYFHL